MQQRPATLSMRLNTGFTLVEVIIAMGILALISVLSWRGLDAISRTRSITAQNSKQMLTLQIALAQWRADLDAALPDVGISAPNPSEGSHIKINPIDWNGNTLRIVRRASLTTTNSTSLSLDNPTYTKQHPELVSAATQVVAWSMHANCYKESIKKASNNCWKRWQSPLLYSVGDQHNAWQQAAAWGAQAGNTQSAQTILPVIKWQVSFFNKDEWINLANVATGNAQTAWEKPEAVRLELEIADTSNIQGKITLDWLSPTLNRVRN